MALPRIYFGALTLLMLSAAPLAATGSDAVVAPLMVRDLIGMPGKEVNLETVEYPPGGKSPPHRHHAQVFVYVLEGSLRMSRGRGARKRRGARSSVASLPRSC